MFYDQIYWKRTFERGPVEDMHRCIANLPKFCRREGGDSHVKMMEYSPPRLELTMDYAWNQYNRRGISVDCR